MGGRRFTGPAVGAGALLVAAVLVAGQVLAGASGPGPQGKPVAPVVSTHTADADDDCGQATGKACGNEHSAAVRKWVACKEKNGKDACTKPTPPGQALGHTKHAGTAPGPASTHGQGHGWGRAHAPGQLKDEPDHADGNDTADEKAG